MNKTTKLKTGQGHSGKAPTPTAINTKAGNEADANEHDYAMETNAVNKRKEIAPTTPSKTPICKKSKGTEQDDVVSNSTILEAIQSMAQKFDEQLTDLREQAKQSSCMIASLAKAVQFNNEEIKECKIKITETEKQNELLTKENKELRERIKEQERYKMRWCLKVQGMVEKNGENIRKEVLQFFNKIIPDMEARQMEDAVDIVHRVGKREGNRPRAVVVLFSRRLVKEEIWRRSRDSTEYRGGGVRLAEMLPQEDREARKKLWPQIEMARREGKRAYFRGPHGYIEGRQIG